MQISDEKFVRHDRGTTSHFLRNTLFSTKTPHTTQLMTADTILKSSLSCPALSILWRLNCFVYIAAKLCIAAVSNENCNMHT